MSCHQSYPFPPRSSPSLGSHSRPFSQKLIHFSACAVRKATPWSPIGPFIRHTLSVNRALLPSCSPGSRAARMVNRGRIVSPLASETGFLLFVYSFGWQRYPDLESLPVIPFALFSYRWQSLMSHQHPDIHAPYGGWIFSVLVGSVRHYHPNNAHTHSIHTPDDRAVPALGSPGICQYKFKCPPAPPVSQISDVNAFLSFPWVRRTRGMRKNPNLCGSPHLQLITQVAGMRSLGWNRVGNVECNRVNNRPPT